MRHRYDQNGETILGGQSALTNFSLLEPNIVMAPTCTSISTREKWRHYFGRLAVTIFSLLEPLRKVSLVFRMLSFRSIGPLFDSSNGNILAILKMRRFSAAQPRTGSARVHALCTHLTICAVTPALACSSNSAEFLGCHTLSAHLI